jgi:DNA-binding beta-propeller fold protein YncE
MSIRHLILLLPAITLAACAQGTLASPSGPIGLLPTAKRTDVVFIIKIPRARHVAHRPRYVSPSTKSISVNVFNSTHKRLLATTIQNLTTASQGCSTPPSGTLICTFSANVPPGHDTFDVTTFDQTGAAGKKLSALSDFSFDVVTGRSNTIGMTLGGLATAISVTAPSVPEVSGSQDSGFTIFGSTPLNFTIVPTDADGNLIIGPGAPAVTLSSTPTHMTVAAPAPGSDTWTLTSTFTATDPGVGVSATLAVQATPVPDSGGIIAVASSSLSLNQNWFYVGTGGGLGLFTFDDRGNATAPSPGFSSIGRTFGIAYDPNDGLLYVGNLTSGTIQAYSRTGALQSTTFSGPTNPFNIVYDSQNMLIYVVYGGVPNGSVNVYDEQGVQQSVGGFAGVPKSPYGMAFDSSNDFLYITNFSGGVAVYDESGIAQSGFSFANTSDPAGIVYDPHNGLIYVANYNVTGADAITVYTEGGLNVQGTLTGNWAGVKFPEGLAFDPHTNLIYVANNQNGTVTAYDEKGNQQSLTGFAGMTSGEEIDTIAVVP